MSLNEKIKNLIARLFFRLYFGGLFSDWLFQYFVSIEIVSIVFHLEVYSDGDSRMRTSKPLLSHSNLSLAHWRLPFFFNWHSTRDRSLAN